MPDIRSLHVERHSGRVQVMAVLVVMLLGGCTTLYARLPSEQDEPTLRAMLDRTDATDVHKHVIPVDLGDGYTAGMVCQERGRSNATRMIVLIPGVASDGSMCRYQVGALVEQGWLVCVMDFIGCGESDAPDPRQLSRDAYSPPWLARSVLQALRAQLKDAPAEQRITLVGHSLGGMVILHMLSDPQLRADFADVLARVDGTVRFTAIDVAVEKDQPLFKMLRELTDAQVAMADGWEFCDFKSPQGSPRVS